jgi:hypothetical protein
VFSILDKSKKIKNLIFKYFSFIFDKNVALNSCLDPGKFFFAGGLRVQNYHRETVPIL